MAHCQRAIRQSARLLHTTRPNAQFAIRAPSSISQLCPRIVPMFQQPLRATQCRQIRTFKSSPRRRITGQEAPSAQAYISSGILGGNKNLVDVKKVIVIGSGGLSIGQAGEFDYSGRS